jgi:integrase/recombinase XerC
VSDTWHRPTIRAYQGGVRLFTEFLVDARYGWGPACEKAFGAHPVAICHEWNTLAHLSGYEGSPEAGPFTREEMQRFLDYAGDQVERAVRSGRKGALAAYRDATIFKVIYGWGLRRTETARLDVADFGRNPRAPQFGRYGTLNVRYGKAKRGQPPRRRNVLSVMGWAVEAVADYAENLRPRFGYADHPALWVTERGSRVRPSSRQHRYGVQFSEHSGRLSGMTGSERIVAGRRERRVLARVSRGMAAEKC